MTDIQTIEIGDLILVSDKIRDVIIYHNKIGRIKENQIGLFLGFKRHSHKKDIFWTVEILLDNKKIMMFSPTCETDFITKINIEEV